MARSALVIAVAAYQDSRLSALKAPVADAQEVADVLGNPAIGGFDVQVSVNETEAVLRRVIGRFFADRGRDDLLLMYISCHGIKDARGRLYFGASDTEIDNIVATGLSADFVSQQMEESRSRTIVFILDCCYGGAFERGIKAGPTLDVGEHLIGQGRVVITSSSAMEYAFEGSELVDENVTSSIFTNVFVRGLRTGDADLDQDGLITIDEIYEYIVREMHERNAKQTPTMSSRVTGRIVLARSPHAVPQARVSPTDASLRQDSATDTESGTDGFEAGPRGRETIPAAEPIVTNDYWTVADDLDYFAYADAIAEFLLHHGTAPPLTIGIKGPWGAGKTSLMHMVQDRLDPPQAGDERRQWINLTSGSRIILSRGSRRRSSRRGRQVASVGTRDVSNGAVLHRLDEQAWATHRWTKESPDIQESMDHEPIRAEPPSTDSWRPTVWFNPWMYESGEQIWAGLAKEIITQITERMHPIEREAFWLELNLRRVDAETVRRRIHQALLQRLFPIAAVIMIAGLGALSLLAVRLIFPDAAHMLGLATGGILATTTAGGLLAIATRVTTFWRDHVGGSISALVKQPDYAQGWQRFLNDQGKTTLADAMRGPAYDKHLGLLYLIQTDMRQVLDLVATRDRPLVLFVDDLDRCSPKAVARVIEAMNLFLAGQFPNCIFILAMEPEMVAAHIEVAYKDLATTLSGEDYWDDVGTLGWRFLDKVVQLPISLPVLGSQQADNFLRGALLAQSALPDRQGKPSLGVSQERALKEAIQGRNPRLGEIAETAAAAQEQVIGTANGIAEETKAAMRRELRRRLRPDDPEIRNIVATAAGRLTKNPREIKKFVNVFRFYTVIRQEREVAGLPAPDSLDEIAKLAVIAVRWPHLRGALGHQIGPTDRDTLLSLLEAPIADLGDDATWQARKSALQSVLLKADIPERLSAQLLGCEDLCTLLACQPPIGTSAAGYL